jgi:hypothetical protein
MLIFRQCGKEELLRESSFVLKEISLEKLRKFLRIRGNLPVFRESFLI